MEIAGDFSHGQRSVPAKPVKILFAYLLAYLGYTARATLIVDVGVWNVLFREFREEDGGMVERAGFPSTHRSAERADARVRSTVVIALGAARSVHRWSQSHPLLQFASLPHCSCCTYVSKAIARRQNVLRGRRGFSALNLGVGQDCDQRSQWRQEHLLAKASLPIACDFRRLICPRGLRNLLMFRELGVYGNTHSAAMLHSCGPPRSVA